MRIIEPTFEILDDYFKQGKILEQIERCGRVCYKSEDRITKDSAIPFIKGIIKRGHESVLEMAQIVLEIRVDSEAIMHKFFERIPRFCQADKLERHRYILSANPRAFRDLARDHKDLKLVKALLHFLTDKYPVLFEDLKPKRGWIPQDGISLKLLSPQEIDNFDLPLLLRHRCLLVHFTVNRAVTHELVRHRIASYLQESQRYCRYGEEKFGGQVAFIKPCFFSEGSEEFNLWKKAMEQSEKIYLELLKTSSPQAARTVLPNSCKTEIMVHCSLAEWVHILRLRASKAADPSMREIMLKLLPALNDKFPSVFTPLLEAVKAQEE